MPTIGVVAVTASLMGTLLIIPPPSRLQARVSAAPEALAIHSARNADHDTISDVSTPAPAPFHTPIPRRVATRRHTPVRGTATPAAHRDWLTSDDGTLHTSVGVYTDCSGRTPLTHAAAAIDTCIAGPTYFVGHNAGVFTPLLHLDVGAIITYYDGEGISHVWRIVSVRAHWHAANGPPPPTQPDVVAQFQTCASADGSVDRILDALPA
jgi:hypothetical protein